MSRLTIASYPGGKSNNKKHFRLYSTIPMNIPYLIEPFAGLANFFINTSSKVKQLWLNDKDPEIYAILQCIRDYNLLDDLIQYTKYIEPIEKEDYYYWKKSERMKTLDKAMRRIILLNCSVNGAGGGYSEEKAHRKWYTNKPKIWKRIQTIFYKRKTRITNLDYSEVLKSIQDEKDCFVYLDPPYFEVAEKGKLYGKEYNTIDWKNLKNILSDVSYLWLLSSRDTPEMRELFSEFYQKNYNTYNDMNNTKNSNPELIVGNYPLT